MGGEKTKQTKGGGEVGGGADAVYLVMFFSDMYFFSEWHCLNINIEYEISTAVYGFITLTIWRGTATDS